MSRLTQSRSRAVPQSIHRDLSSDISCLGATQANLQAVQVEERKVLMAWRGGDLRVSVRSEKVKRGGGAGIGKQLTVTTRREAYSQRAMGERGERVDLT